MPIEPRAIKLAEDAWKTARKDLSEIGKKLATRHSEHRGDLKRARETGEDPKGLIVEGESSALISTFRVAVSAGGGSFEQEFTIVYNAGGQCCYLVSPSDAAGCQLVSGSDDIAKLPEIVRAKIYPGLVAWMDTLDDDAAISATVEPVEEAGFGLPVMAEYIRVGRFHEGERVLSTQPVAARRAMLAQAPAPRM